MIVIGVDVHKQSLTAVAVDELGRAVAALTVGSPAELVAWSGSLDPERLWAVEDCRQLTGPLERRLLAAGESLVRVPPKLMAPERRAGRARGKSDPIDALAVARAALREPHLDRPRPGEAALRELKLLVDHRDDLIDERRRAQQRLRWQLHDLDPQLAVPPGALDRPLWLDRVDRRLRGEIDLGGLRRHAVAVFGRDVVHGGSAVLARRVVARDGRGAVGNGFERSAVGRGRVHRRRRVESAARRCVGARTTAARGSSPSNTRSVHGMQPIERKPSASSGWRGRPRRANSRSMRSRLKEASGSMRMRSLTTEIGATSARSLL